MIDLVKLILVAGDGGHGKVSFRRERRIPKGGPDGGDGGNGGSVIIRGNRNLATLKHFSGKVLFQAEDGVNGEKRKMIGRKGENLVLEVPIGTSIGITAETANAKKRRQFLGIYGLFKRDGHHKEKYYLEKEGQSIPQRDPEDFYMVGSGEPVPADVQEILTATQRVEPLVVTTIDTDGQEVVVCQGGFGGHGNEYFKSSVKTTPLEAEYGSFGEKRAIVLELKLLADVGLVGFPNAGKSTLLSVVTKARPKIASYPFTTIEPNLGILDFSDGKQSENTDLVELVLADIPGLIGGASEGKGLGHTFLRHVENCSTLLFVLSLTEEQVFDQTTTDEQKAQLLIEQFEQLQHEIGAYKKLLLGKTSIVSINKKDLYSTELITAINKAFKKKKIEIVLFSAATKEGLTQLSSLVRSTVR